MKKPIKPESTLTPFERQEIAHLRACAGLPCLQCQSRRVSRAGSPCPFCSLALPERDTDGRNLLEVQYFLAVLTPEEHAEAAARWSNCTNARHRQDYRGGPIELCPSCGGPVENRPGNVAPQSSALPPTYDSEQLTLF